MFPSGTLCPEEPASGVMAGDIFPFPFLALSTWSVPNRVHRCLIAWADWTFEALPLARGSACFVCALPISVRSCRELGTGPQRVCLASPQAGVAPVRHQGQCGIVSPPPDRVSGVCTLRIKGPLESGMACCAVSNRAAGLQV